MRNIPPLVNDSRFRIEMTVSCEDAESIPKVRNAGAVEQAGQDSVQVMHNGIRVLAGGYHGEWMSEIIRRLRGHHEPQEELVFFNILKFLPENARMIELGSFWSYYSLWFLKDCPNRLALCVEPDPIHIEIGRKNALLNGLSLEIQQGCLGSGDPKMVSFASESSGVIEIPMLKTSAICEDFAASGLDVLHMDVQGAELEVLRDCKKQLTSGKIRFVVVSTHAECISGSPLTHQDCLDLIVQCGGQVLEEHDVHESFSGDGLIAAHFGPVPIDWPDLDISYNRYSTSLFRNPLYDLNEARESLAGTPSEVVEGK